MSISKLIRTIDQYDPYGMHRLNGMKVVYVLLVLFFVNLFFYIPNPYFYFFFVPISAMNAEVIGLSIKSKYKLFIYAGLGSCGIIFLFNLLKPYPAFFLLFGFVATLFLYGFVLRKRSEMMVLVPIILSLAAYSLLYGAENNDFYAVFNNAVTTLISMMIILGALVLFPLSYYYRLWLRALSLLLQECLDNFVLLHEKKHVNTLSVQGHTMHLFQFSQLLPRSLPVYTILKINLLINQLHLMGCVASPDDFSTDPSELQRTIQGIHALLRSIKKEESCPFMAVGNPALSHLIRSWNYLCLKL